jgi:hypothetical protein
MRGFDSSKAGGGRPIVLIVDDFGWESFYQAAAAFRREGIGPVRVRVGGYLPRPSPRAAMRAIADGLFYDETILLCRPAGRTRLQRLLDGCRIADVLVNEPTLMKIGADSALARRLTEKALAHRATPPAVLLDKFEVGRRLRDAGFATPRQAAAEALSPCAAAHALGLPLLVKDRIAAGGDGVRLATSLPAIERALEELGGDCSRLFYEEYVEGDVLLYASVTGREGLLVGQGFRVERVQYPLGPASVLSLVDDADLMAAGARAAELFGHWGFADLGFIRGRNDGRLYLFDANFRFSGYMCAPLEVGLDMIAAYAAMICGRPWTHPAARAPGDRELWVQPFGLLEAAAHGPADNLRSQAGIFFKHYLPVLGPRYLAYLALALGGALSFRARARMATPGRLRLHNQFS